MDWISALGLVGALIAGGAYAPQIMHLWREHCAAGISRRAYLLWLIASILVTTHAVAIGSFVFIVLGVVQIVSTATILVLSIRFSGMTCPIHAASHGALSDPSKVE